MQLLMLNKLIEIKKNFFLFSLKVLLLMNQGQTLSNVVINSAQDGEVLQYDGTSGVWRNEEPSSSSVVVQPGGGLSENGTSTDPLYFSELTTNGDLLSYDSGLERLPIGTTGQILTVSGGFPTWQSPTPAPTYQRFAAYWTSSTPQTLAANGNLVMSNYSTIIITNSNFNNSTGQFTIPTAGLYIVTINSNIQSPNGTSVNTLMASLSLTGTDRPGMSPTGYATDNQTGALHATAEYEKGLFILQGAKKVLDP
jgi:hypothetical protein